MVELLKTIGSVILILVLLELLNLPDWISRKLRGDITNKEMMEKIKSLEDRIQKLEEKVK